MYKLERIDSDTHQNIKVSQKGALEKNSNVHMCHIVIPEFANISQFYPIFFTKDNETGQFQPVALFGLAVDENIYQACGLWQKCYIPLKIQSQPFYLVKSETLNQADAEPSLAIDTKDARVQSNYGEALFIDGNATTYLQHKAVLLAELTHGFVLNDAFISSLLNHDLLESVTLDIQYNASQAQKLTGLYTINKEMLEKVPTDVQKAFEQQGYVALISSVLSSVNHISTLIEIKNTLKSKK